MISDGGIAVVKSALRSCGLERIIVHDSRFLFTLSSYAIILLIYVNLNTAQSFAVAIIAFFLYFLINSTFLAHAFFRKDSVPFRLAFGVLLLIMFLGCVGWVIMIIYDLDSIRFILVLIIAATISSLSNRRMKDENFPR